MSLAGTTTSSSILHIKMSGKTKTQHHPLGIHQFALLNGNLRKKTHSFVNFTNNFLKIDYLQNGLIDLPTLSFA